MIDDVMVMMMMMKDEEGREGAVKKRKEKAEVARVVTFGADAWLRFSFSKKLNNIQGRL